MAPTSKRGQWLEKDSLKASGGLYTFSLSFVVFSLSTEGTEPNMRLTVRLSMDY